MDIITDVHPNASSLVGSRNPLLPRITSPQQTPANNIRRKGSFIRAIPDSSEESPLSSDNSIFEAFLFSNSNSEDSVHKFDTLPRSKQAACEVSSSNDENMRQTSTSTQLDTTVTTEFLYGHGTVLDTITEQKSYGTMRSVTRTKSADDISTSPLLGHRDSFTIAKNRPRHKQSFSLDDIWCIKDSYHDACAMIDQAARRRLSIHEVYAKPKEPLLAPPERPDTPPGSFNSSSYSSSKTTKNAIIGAHTFTNTCEIFFTGRVVSAPGLAQLPPRFRAPRSVYSAIDTHPFSSAPVHKIDPEPPIEAPRPIVAPILSHHPRTSSLPSAAPLTSTHPTGKGKGNPNPNSINGENDGIRRASLSPSLISYINAEFPNTSRDDVDLGIIDLERENRTSVHTRSPGTPLTSRSASANTSANASGYFMSGALHIPHVERGEQQALNVPILTGRE
ncbi:hypothetical protein H4I96_01313 [Botrytis cinerea]